MKPIAAVVAEDTIFDQMDTDLMALGLLRTGVRERLAELAETYYLLVVTPFARTDRGLHILQARLHEESVPFNEIWCGQGLPVTAVRFDNGAKKL